jgi:translation initiation factor 2 gamma subunit (eIF-2gamma)
MTEPTDHARNDESFIPRRGMRLRAESYAMRIVATGGIIGIGTALAAILQWGDVRGWIVGLVVSTLSVLLAAVLWSSRTL